MICTALSALVASASAQGRLAHIEGEHFISAPDGRVLHIKGISLGNWLMPEAHMFKFEVAKAPAESTAPSTACWAPTRPLAS